MAVDEPRTHYDHYRAAKTYEKNGDYDAALTSYAKAIEMEEDYAYAWYYKGLLHKKMGQYSDAISCTERALALEPSWEKHCSKVLEECKSKL